MVNAVRDYRQSDPRFLNIEKDQELSIIGIDYSRRPDNFFAEFNGTRGFIFDNHIEPWPYVLFLEECLEKNTRLFRVQHNDDANQANRFVGTLFCKGVQFLEEVECFPTLYMKYKVGSAKIDFPLSEKIQSMMLDYQALNAGHSHSHSHSHGHSHSHDGHSHNPDGQPHDNPAPTPAVKTDEPIIQKPVEVVKPLTTNEILESTENMPRPAETVKPVEAAPPIDLPKPVDQIKTAEFSAKLEPPKPAEQIKAAEKVNLQPDQIDTPFTLPEKPVEVPKSLAANEVVENTELPEPAETVKPVEAVDLPKPVEQIRMAEVNAQSEQNDAPLTSPEKPVEVVKPLATDEILESTENIKLPRPPETVKPVEAAPPIDIPKPVEQIKEVSEHPEQKVSPFTSPENSSIYVDDSAVRSATRKIVMTFRTNLPTLNYFDDTGIFIIAYLITAIVIYLSSFVLSSSKCPDAIDRRALYDAQTVIQEQKVELQELRRNAPSEAQLTHQKELRQLCNDQRHEIESLRSRLIDPEVVAEYERQIREFQNTITSLTSEKASLSESLNLMTEAKNMAESSLVDSVKVNEEKLAQLTKDAQINLREATSAKNENVQITSKLCEQDKKLMELECTLAEKTAYASELKEQYDAVLSLIAEQKAAESGGEDAAESGESGASGSGWSDVGNDVDIDGVDGVDKKDEDTHTDQRTVRAKSKPPSVSDLEDLAKARAELLKVSKERDSLRMELHTIRETRQALIERVERLERDVTLENDRAGRIQREYDDQREQVKGLFQMDQKLSTVQAELSAAQAEFSTLKDTLFKTESKARDLENERQHNVKLLESLRENESRLRNQWFHEEKKFSNKIRELEQTVAKLQSSIPLANATMEVTSPSSTRELLGASGEVPSLWSPFANTSGDVSLDESDISRTDQRRRSIREPHSSGLLRTHTGSSSGLNVLLPRYSNRDSFTGIRDESDTLPAVRGTAGRRMRSRSAGRLNREHRNDVDSGGYSSGRRSVHRPGHISPATSLLLHSGSGTNRNSDKEIDGRSSDGAYPR